MRPLQVPQILVYYTEYIREGQSVLSDGKAPNFGFGFKLNCLRNLFKRASSGSDIIYQYDYWGGDGCGKNERVV